MNHTIAQLTRVTACAVCLVLLAAAVCHAAPPQPDQPAAIDTTSSDVATPSADAKANSRAAEDELLERMLTPTAEIRLGPGAADTERLMRRSIGASLLYTVRSAWRGIVEYLFPPHGLFRGDDALARVYDPELLADLERARQLMATADVSPLTIAVSPRRRVEEEPRAEDDAETGAEATAGTTPPPDPTADEAAGLAAAPAPSPPPLEIDFDFVANEAQQAELREKAALAGEVVSATMTGVREALDALNAAREETAQRRELLEAGVLADGAVRPAEERLESALAGWEAAEGELIEAQAGYDRLAERIARLEEEAAAAHFAIRQARETRAREATRRAEAEQAESEEPSAPPRPVELRRAEEPAERAESADSARARSYPMAREVTELAAPRWQELTADAAGLVSDILAPQGTLVEAGDELLRVANLQLAQLTACVTLGDLPEFRVGRAVTVCFDDYPEVVFQGWVASIGPATAQDAAEVELLVVCDSGPFTDDPYLALRWMTLQAGVGETKVASTALEAVREPPPSAEIELQLLEIFPTIGPRDAYTQRVTEPQVPRRDRYTGRLRLTPVPRFAGERDPDSVQARRLAAINQWRESYIDGMATTILDDGTVLTYPADGEIHGAVRAMLGSRVSHRPNLCAATMREALGWGLGDAHHWAARLPRMGYVERADRLPRPGDILVWPFTYGPGRSQHIGIAVRQGRKLMLLSNLGGRLGTSEIVGGYMAFHRPDEETTS